MSSVEVSGEFDLDKVAARGIQLCREDQWERGLRYLSAVAQSGEGKGQLPALFYSYLGAATARIQKQYKSGLQLCQRAVEMEFYQPESYLNLARTYLLLEDRRKAYEALAKGLRIDPANRLLRKLRRDEFARQRLIIPFLSRSNLINRLLGRLRHDIRLTERRHKAKVQEDKELYQL